MLDGSNPYAIDNPRLAISNAAEITPVSEICAAWLIGLPRRAGTWLHAGNDAEARWWSWHVTERYGGLGRRYRDARFEALRHDPSLRRDEHGPVT